ncbi:MAG: hypothetical protein NZM10_02660 [Fimbriimonadales bacterium]|nr:hypothetical protein [Fimbriimonadales bacterium]
MRDALCLIEPAQRTPRRMYRDGNQRIDFPQQHPVLRLAQCLPK